MEREELRGKQTPGTWVWYKRDDIPTKWNGITAHDGEEYHQGMGHESAGRGEWNAWINVSDADAALIAEAGTVANRTGLWPLDMEQRIKELESLVGRMKDRIYLKEYERAMELSSGHDLAYKHAHEYPLVAEARAILSK